MRPLGKVRGELAALRDSASARLPESSLREIQPLTDAINSLADARERDLELARRRAADLAHGLKTPLAALAAQSRRAGEAGATAAAEGMDRAIAAIGATIDAELARARIAAVGRKAGAFTSLRAAVERVVTVLEHTEKGGQLAFSLDIPASLQLAIRPDDLSEILGAVLENAVKYARRQVRVSGGAGPEWTSLAIEDDGPGIAQDRVDDALMRGGRLDESGGGSGLGLAIARELVEATGGTIELDQSSLGGLRIRFSWAARSSVNALIASVNRRRSQMCQVNMASIHRPVRVAARRLFVSRLSAAKRGRFADCGQLLPEINPERSAYNAPVCPSRELIREGVLTRARHAGIGTG